MTSGDGAYRIADVAVAVALGFLVMVLLFTVGGLISTVERTGAACVKLCAPLPVKSMDPSHGAAWCICGGSP